MIAAPCGLLSSTRIAKTSPAAKPAPRDDGRRRAPRRLRPEDGDEHQEPGGRQHRERRREREPVDVRLRDHGATACVVGALLLGAEGVAADRVRPGREHEQDQDERHDDRELAGAQVERRVVDGRPDVLVEHGRDQPQHVHRGEHDRDRADDRPAPALLEDAREDQELAGEVRRQRHGERHHADRHQDRRERRPAAGHAAEARELARRGAPLDHPGEQEHAHREQPVVDHLQHRAVQAEAVEGEEAEADQPHLGERGVRDRHRGRRAHGTRAASRRRARSRRARGSAPGSRATARET